MTPAQTFSHFEYAIRATIVIGIGCWMAAMIGYFVPDSSEVEA